ncbi:MAG: hypothetical protein NTY99_00230 [DPANN group archaeon]|nr:hypothetical protein [DPANN group archaeon]
MVETLYSLLNKKFVSRNPKNVYEYAEFYRGNVKYVKSGTIGLRSNSIMIDISMKSHDAGFEVPPKVSRLPGQKCMVATVYNPNPEEMKIDYRAKILKHKMKDWVRKVDDEVAQGKRNATFTYQLGEFILSFNNLEKDINLMTTHDTELSKIEEILQKKPKVFSE